MNTAKSGTLYTTVVSFFENLQNDLQRYIYILFVNVFATFLETHSVTIFLILHICSILS